jgi:ribonuclease HI
MDEINISTDGGARGNPGKAACAFVVQDSNGNTLFENSFFLGIATNNEAEYQGLIEASTWLSTFYKSNTNLKKVNFLLDSQLVVNQMKGIFKVKENRLFVLKNKCQLMLSSLPLNVSFSYIPRAQNHRADFLLNQKLDQQ